MPAAAEEYRDPGDAGRNQANWPEPAGMLGFLGLVDFFHRTVTDWGSYTSA